MRRLAWAMPAALVLGAVSSGIPTAWAAEGTSAGEWLWSAYRAGGWFMHPILACWAIAVTVTLERAWSLWRDRSDRARLVAEVRAALGSGAGEEGGAGHGEDARRAAERHRGPLARVLAHGLVRTGLGREAVARGLEAAAAVEVYQMERGLLWLATVANVAPLLGFLGTVSGMIHAFEDIARAEQVSARIVARGISEALLTTAAGLIVAIPAQAAYNLFVGRIERFAVEVEEASDDLLHAWAVRGGRG